MELIKGIQAEALKLVVYGPEGIGKSTFASYFPSPVFIDTEGSTSRMDVMRTPKPSSWSQILEQVKYFIQRPSELSTLVIDTADWAEKLCTEQICASKQMKSIEDAGYGRGYVYLAEEFGKLLNLLDELRGKGIHIVLTAHAAMRKFEQPDEMGAYDRWELKLQKKTAPMVKEWADALFFINYKTFVVNVDGQGTGKGKNKAQGGSRIMYTAHHPCWDAKNRFGLPDEMPFEFGGIAHLFPGMVNPVTPVQGKADTLASEAQKTILDYAENAIKAMPGKPQQAPATPVDLNGIPKPLADLMAENQVTPDEVQTAVALRGYYPKLTPIKNYDPQFIAGVLVGAWPQVFQMILDIRNEESPI
jgi:GTPase SAR1 family protein